MKIAVVGTGIAGNVVANRLHTKHEISVFEADGHIGGHTHTHELSIGDDKLAVDSGFIVFNHRTYPNFVALFQELGVAEQPSDMSFSVKCEKTGLEYNGTGLNALFAQRKNLIKPSFYRMLREILRFNRTAPELLNQDLPMLTLGEYLAQHGYSRDFIDHYVVPMGAAVWSADPRQMFDFPARFFVQFFQNHGLLSIDDRPQWYVIRGGSKSYVDKLTAPFREKIRLNTRVKAIRRFENHVELTLQDGLVEKFDRVFVASHSDQALRMLVEPTEAERSVLNAIPYQENEAVLHTDTSVLPRKRLAWAAWNYHILGRQQDRVAVTYNMNILQGLKSKTTFCVTLNNSNAIDPSRVIKRMTYHHPMFTPDSMLAQKRHGEINGQHHVYFCGAYWRYGFHEDGVVSALSALRHFEKREQSSEQLYLRWAG